MSAICTHRRLALFALLGGCGGLAASLDDPTSLNVRRGQTPAEVRDRLGPPSRVSRQLLFRRTVEQWVYDGPRPTRIEFVVDRGAEPYVSAILPVSSTRP